MRALILAALLLMPVVAFAQDQTVEDKLREALRRSTVDLRALQDSQAQLRAERDAAARQRDTLQQQLTDASAKLAEAQAAPKAPALPPPDPDEVRKLQEAIDAARRENRELAASNAKWQDSYRKAAAIAQAKDAEAKRLDQGFAAARKENQLSRDTNTKLATLAHDILHLYEQQGFRSTLLRSYEPVLGLDKVKLDNLVQDYDDKIYDLRLFQTRAASP